MCSDLRLGRVNVCALLFRSTDTYFSEKYKSVFTKMELANNENEKYAFVKEIVKTVKLHWQRLYVLIFR